MNKSKAWIYLFIINYILWAIPAEVCIGKGNPVSGSSNIILKAWTDKKDYTYPSPVIICAELRRNQSITGAVLKAIVTAPNGEQFTVPVEDNGFNSDDQPMDGRYIGSFTAFSGNGKYQIRVLADNSKHTATEGGFSDVPPLPGKSTSSNISIAADFSCTQLLPTISVTGVGSTDCMPPGKITYVDTDDTSKPIRIYWFAPGDDFYSGTATCYEGRYCSGEIDNEDDWNAAAPFGGMPQPLEAGKMQEAYLPQLAAGEYCAAIRTYDEAGNASPFSRVFFTVSDQSEKDQTDPGPIQTGLTDIKGHWARSYIEPMIAQGYVHGYPDGLFKPENTITRGETAKIISVFTKNIGGNQGNMNFCDNNQIPFWARSAIEAVFTQGFMNGVARADGSLAFEADRPITRAEMAVILAKLLQQERGTKATKTSDFIDDSSIPAWSRDAIDLLAVLDIMTGYPDSSFRAEHSLSRAEAAVLLSKTLARLKKSEG